jgi:molybdopterin converting factor small subunit
MKIRVLAFATASDLLGSDERELELPAGSRVADLRAILDGRFPSLSPLWPRLAVAVDGRIAGPEVALAEGCEVALLPPVSGG